MLVKWVLRAIRDYLLPIALGGLIGGLLVAAFFVWPTINEAKWWEVLTAFGTVCAAGVGALSWIYVWIKDDKEKKHRQKVLLHEHISPVLPIWSSYISGFFQALDRVSDRFHDGSILERNASLRDLAEKIETKKDLKEIVLPKEDLIMLGSDLFQKVDYLAFLINKWRVTLHASERGGVVRHSTQISNPPIIAYYLNKDLIEDCYDDLAEIVSCFRGLPIGLYEMKVNIPEKEVFMKRLKNTFTPKYL